MQTYATILDHNDPRLKEPTGRLDPILANRLRFTPDEYDGALRQRAEVTRAFNALRVREVPFGIAALGDQLQKQMEEHARMNRDGRVGILEAMLDLSDDDLALLAVALIPPPAFAVIGGIRRYFQHPAAGTAATAVVGTGIEAEAGAAAKEDFEAVAAGANASGAGAAPEGDDKKKTALKGFGILAATLAVLVLLFFGLREK
jgi:hypothetical protein